MAVRSNGTNNQSGQIRRRQGRARPNFDEIAGVDEGRGWAARCSQPRDDCRSAPASSSSLPQGCSCSAIRAPVRDDCRRLLGRLRSAIGHVPWGWRHQRGGRRSERKNCWEEKPYRLLGTGIKKMVEWTKNRWSRPKTRWSVVVDENKPTEALIRPPSLMSVLSSSRPGAHRSGATAIDLILRQVAGGNKPATQGRRRGGVRGLERRRGKAGGWVRRGGVNLGDGTGRRRSGSSPESREANDRERISRGLWVNSKEVEGLKCK